MSPSSHRLVLAGGSGFLGQALAKHFVAAGWEVAILTRHTCPARAAGKAVVWDGCTAGSWRRELEGAKAVVNLSGQSVNCRYTSRNRRRILDSRLEPTRALGLAIRNCSSPPEVWLNASTATIYKHTFGPPWDESGQTEATPEAKDAFSVAVAHAWEKALAETATPRTRRVALRTAMVLGHGPNSVFPVLRRLAKLGFGGRMGSGRQFVSWIHLEDFCRSVEWLIRNEALAGPVNLAAPEPLPNAEMMRQMRGAAGRGFGMPTPGWLLEIGALLLGTETELIIKSRRVIPARLTASGFAFRFPTLEGALKDLCTQD